MICLDNNCHLIIRINIDLNTGVSQAVNISWLVGCHPVLDPMVLTTEANRTISILLKLLQSAGSLPGCLTITVVNW